MTSHCPTPSHVQGRSAHPISDDLGLSTYTKSTKLMYRRHSSSGGTGITLAGSEGLVAAEVSGVLSVSRRSDAGRSGVALPGRSMALTLADDSPAEWGRSRRGAIVSLTPSPSLSGFSPTLTMGADLHTRTQVL